MSLLLLFKGGGAVTHDTTGALTGQGSSVSGSAARTRSHATSGVLTAQGSTVAGSAARARAHDAAGVLNAGNAIIVGSASRTSGAVTHATSGDLVAQGSAVAGSAARTRAHASAGALTGQGSAVAGSAARTRTHVISGALAGQGSVVAGDAALTAYDLSITREQAQLIHQIYLLHGLRTGKPLSVGPTAREVGTLAQTVEQVGATVTVETTATDEAGLPALTTMISELAAIHGLGVDPLVVTPTSRTVGSISQTLAVSGGVTTVTRV